MLWLIVTILYAGMVTTTQKIDYETTPQLNFSVMAYDSGAPQFSAQAYVTVNINNINDMDPVFNQVNFVYENEV